MLSLLLLLSPLPASPMATPAPIVDHDDDKWERKRHREREKEDRRYWKEREKEERRYWKARKHGERHRFHEREADHDDHRDWDHGRPRHRHVCPPWMQGYWRSGDRRYVALVPGDPSRMYVFLDGRWVLRRVTESRARVDLEGAFRLPVAPPPVPLPNLGLNLHVVLFD